MTEHINLIEKEKYDQKLMNSLLRAIGHLKSVRTMVEEGRDCSEVLIQLSAVKSIVHIAGKEILKKDIQNFIAEAVEQNNSNAIRRVKKDLDWFLK